MARHVIGLNHYAIGIENVGGIDGKDDLTEQQAEANAFLVCYLKNKYPQIEHVIGHHEYLGYKNSALWLEKDPEYERSKTDPGPDFVNRVKALAMESQAQPHASVISTKHCCVDRTKQTKLSSLRAK